MNHVADRMIHIGIVGLGYMGAHHLKILVAMKKENIFPNIDIHLISDPDTDRLEMWSKKLTIQGSVNPDDVLESESINTVFIASPLAYHKDQAIKAFETGKAVYLEKPMGLTLADSREIVRKAGESGMRNQVGMLLNHSPLFSYLQELLAQSELGRPRSFKLRHTCPIPLSGIYQGSWRGDRRLSSGLLREANVHDIDLILNLFGDCAIQSVEMNVREILGEDYVKVEMQTRDGAQGVFETQWYDEQQGTTNRNLDIVCENGTIAAHDFFFNGTVTSQINGQDPVTMDATALFKRFVQIHDMDPLVKRVRAWYSSLADYAFIQSISQNLPCHPDVQQGLRAEEKIQEMYDHHTGKP